MISKKVINIITLYFVLTTSYIEARFDANGWLEDKYSFSTWSYPFKGDSFDAGTVNNLIQFLKSINKESCFRPRLFINWKQKPGPSMQLVDAFIKDIIINDINIDTFIFAHNTLLSPGDGGAYGGSSLIFLLGNKRFMEVGATITFHDIPKKHEELVNFISNEIGQPPEYVEENIMKPGKDTTLSAYEALEHRVATDVQMPIPGMHSKLWKYHMIHKKTIRETPPSFFLENSR